MNVRKIFGEELEKLKAESEHRDTEYDSLLGNGIRSSCSQILNLGNLGRPQVFSTVCVAV